MFFSSHCPSQQSEISIGRKYSSVQGLSYFAPVMDGAVGSTPSSGGITFPEDISFWSGKSNFTLSGDNL